MASDLPEGLIIEVVRPRHEWIVRVYGVYWHARTSTHSDFAPDDLVRVIGREGQRLLIAPY